MKRQMAMVVPTTIASFLFLLVKWKTAEEHEEFMIFWAWAEYNTYLFPLDKGPKSGMNNYVLINQTIYGYQKKSFS